MIIFGRENAMGTRGLGTINDNGEKLMDFYMTNGLVIKRTPFEHKKVLKETWIASGDRHRSQIDQIMIESKTLRNVRAEFKADVRSDYILF